MTSHAHYEIRVEGVLDRYWTAWFEGLQITSDGSQTVLSGPLTDQAALHGVLLTQYPSRPGLETGGARALRDAKRDYLITVTDDQERGDRPGRAFHPAPSQAAGWTL